LDESAIEETLIDESAIEEPLTKECHRGLPPMMISPVLAATDIETRLIDA
jgi:hypothetical protein